jgi:hypothetical protein
MDNGLQLVNPALYNRLERRIVLHHPRYQLNLLELLLLRSVNHELRQVHDGGGLEAVWMHAVLELVGGLGVEGLVDALLEDFFPLNSLFLHLL